MFEGSQRVVYITTRVNFKQLPELVAEKLQAIKCVQVNWNLKFAQHKIELTTMFAASLHKVHAYLCFVYRNERECNKWNCNVQNISFSLYDMCFTLIPHVLETAKHLPHTVRTSQNNSLHNFNILNIFSSHLVYPPHVHSIQSPCHKEWFCVAR